jgi:redox-sensitive bicupin YhaK (pirin superfamily)
MIKLNILDTKVTYQLKGTASHEDSKGNKGYLSPGTSNKKPN